MARKGAKTSADPNVEQPESNGKTKSISEYEQCREERIKENLERMQKLGILDLSLQLKSSTKPSPKSTPGFTRKNPLRVSPLPPTGPTRRSSRLQNVIPVSYSEVKLPKKDNSFKLEDNLLREDGSRPEIYTEEHEKLLGSTEQTWTLFVDGCGKDGKRIYDSFSGKTCHQCRQKTLGHRTHCSKCNMVQGQFCGDCLYMRYGEHVLEAKQNPNWICPVCRGICNCSLCRQGKGWAPTGALYRKISSLGYKSVAHYLIQTRRAKTGLEIDLSTKVPLSAKRSLPFEEVKDPSSDKESSELNNAQGLVDKQDNCKLASENTTDLSQPELTFALVNDVQGLPKPESESNDTKCVLQNEKEEIEVLVQNGGESHIGNMKKSEDVPMELLLKESNEDPTRPNPVPEEDGTDKKFKDEGDKSICSLNNSHSGNAPVSEKTPGSKNKRIRTAELVADSISERLRQRRRDNSELLDSSKVNCATLHETKLELKDLSSPVRADTSANCSNFTSSDTDSIAARLKLRGRT